MRTESNLNKSLWHVVIGRRSIKCVFIDPGNIFRAVPTTSSATGSPGVAGLRRPHSRVEWRRRWRAVTRRGRRRRIRKGTNATRRDRLRSRTGRSTTWPAPSSSSVRCQCYENRLYFVTVGKGKLKLTGLNLGRIFNYRCRCASAWISTCASSKQPNLKLRTQPKPVLGYLPLAFALPGKGKVSL
jgi:hypothetical protein